MIQVGFKSDKGIKRRNNEDAFYVMAADQIFMVADGVGGGNAGEIASRTAVSQIVEYIRKNPIDEIVDSSSFRLYFSKCLNGINKQVYTMAKKHLENKGMATTLVLTYIKDNLAYVVNVGDSRAYLFRGGELVQITEDHTYVNTLIRKGAISKEDAKTHQKKHYITRAIGGEEIIIPDFFQVSVQEGDLILLCTDGLHGEVSDDRIVSVLSEGKTMSETCAKLVQRANQSGGNDNITVICLKIQGGSPV